MANHLRRACEAKPPPMQAGLPGARRLHHALSALLLLLSVSARQGLADPLYAKLAPDAAQAFSWFDRLGFPDVKGCKFVRVGTRARYDDGSEYEQPESERIEAFLTETKPNGESTVLTLELLTHHYKQTPADAPVHRSVFFEGLPLEEYAKGRLRELQMPDDDDWGSRFGRRLSERGEAFVLAWGCARNGHITIAQKLYEHAAGMPEPDSNDLTAETVHGGFLRALEGDIGKAMMWQAVLACGHPSTSREDLLKGFERIIRHCPSSEYIPRAKKTAALLKQMIKEDKEHAGKKLKSLAEMSTEERVAELIFQLREQSGRQYIHGGTCDIFWNRQGKTDTPAHQLVTIGHAAVPQLIEALGNQRLTRSVHSHKSFCFTHKVLRIGDRARAILSGIAGRLFYERPDTAGYMTKDGKAKSTKEQVQEWWAAIQEKGEKQVLIEGTAVGDDNAVNQARFLLEKYPEAAFEPIAQGILNAKGSWKRTCLVNLAAKTEGDAAVPVLIREMEKAQSRSTRVTAAMGLHSRGDETGVQGMVREWAIRQPSINRFRGGMRDDDDDDGEDGDWWGGDGLLDGSVERLIAFLAVSDSPVAIKAMADELQQQPIEVKTRVVESMAEDGGSQYEHFLWPRSKGPSSPAVLLEIEALLVAALADTDEAPAAVRWDDGVYPSTPRICDVAGHTLADRWPEKYRFNAKASIKLRDRQRTNCINIWRKEKKLPLLPIPMERPVRRAAREETGPLLNAIRDSQGGKEAESALTALEKLGLPALPAVVETLGELDGHPLHDRVASFAARLSCTVAEASLSPHSLNPSKKLSDLLQRIEGRPLASVSCAQLLESMVKECPRGTKEIRLSVWKDEDLTGITVKAEFLGTPTGEGGVAATGNRPDDALRHWARRVTLSGSPRHPFREQDDWNDGLDKTLRRAIAKALAVGPTEHFCIRVRLQKAE
ncbi:MAG: hypothetical protein HN380_17745 [Victivallales bacterium]|nr:hypothetical protein [Victivallales bacterium]